MAVVDLSSRVCLWPYHFMRSLVFMILLLLCSLFFCSRVREDSSTMPAHISLHLARKFEAAYIFVLTAEQASRNTAIPWGSFGPRFSTPIQWEDGGKVKLNACCRKVFCTAAGLPLNTLLCAV